MVDIAEQHDPAVTVTVTATGFADVAFMGALLAIGIALILGIGMRLAVGGALLTVMMWAAVRRPVGEALRLAQVAARAQQ